MRDWAPWVAAVPAAGGLFAGLQWFYRHVRKWRLAALDRRVLAALGSVWNCGLDANQLAEVLSRKKEAILDSLKRLELNGKVVCNEGSLSHPPSWFARQR
jgi:hypothetical protein